LWLDLFVDFRVLYWTHDIFDEFWKFFERFPERVFEFMWHEAFFLFGLEVLSQKQCLPMLLEILDSARVKG